MTDHLSKELRSWNMSRITSKNTKPELIVRSLLHKMGYRFRLHNKDLPGKPDIVLSKYKTVIFVNGCYWHRHKKCKNCTTPSTNRQFWENKFERTKLRDKKNYKELGKLNWNYFVIWECEIRNMSKNYDKISKMLNEIARKVKH